MALRFKNCHINTRSTAVATPGGLKRTSSFILYSYTLLWLIVCSTNFPFDILHLILFVHHPPPWKSFTWCPWSSVHFCQYQGKSQRLHFKVQSFVFQSVSLSSDHIHQRILTAAPQTFPPSAAAVFLSQITFDTRLHPLPLPLFFCLVTLIKMSLFAANDAPLLGF